MRAPTLRTAVTLMVITPLIAVAAALLLLATMTSRRVSDDLANSIMSASAERIRAEVGDFLAQAMHVSDRYERRLSDGVLADRDLASWRRTLMDDLTTSPSVASIAFGNPAGEAVWLSRDGDDLEFGTAEQGVQRAQRVDANTGAILGPIERDVPYDPRQRPWYVAALESARPKWSPIYFWFVRSDASETGTGYTRAVLDSEAKLRGVLVVDITLSGLSDFLEQLPVARSGFACIVDETGSLVAASDGAVSSPEGKRLVPAESSLKIAQAAAPLLKHSLASARLAVDGARWRAQVTPIRPYPGVEWRALTALPESAFMSEVRAAQRQGFLLAGLSAVGGVVLALLLSQRIARPLVEIGGHVRKVGGGDFSSRLHLAGPRELRDLSDQLNRMSGDLKHRMELEQSLALATEVQQSLLPHDAPQTPGLDVYGKSVYCDSTGGDYFDFIDTANLPGGRLLVGVGDVTGHGIAAALLMATARSAVRVAAMSENSLGGVMAKVNQVLASDTQLGLFMTMTLMVLDPHDGSVRWACAGHDPILVYDPLEDSFSELEEGSFPLGAMPGADFEEYHHHGLRRGSVVLIGTDGIWEARNASEEMYGKERLKESVRRSHAGSARQVADCIDADLSRYLGDRKIQDDVTYVVVKLMA